MLLSLYVLLTCLYRISGGRTNDYIGFSWNRLLRTLASSVDAANRHGYRNHRRWSINHPTNSNTPNLSTPPQNSNPASPGSGQSELHSVSFAATASAAIPSLLHKHSLAFSTPANENPACAHAWRHWFTRSRLDATTCSAEVENAGVAVVSTMQPWYAQLPGRRAGTVYTCVCAGRGPSAPSCGKIPKPYRPGCSTLPRKRESGPRCTPCRTPLRGHRRVLP